MNLTVAARLMHVSAPGARRGGEKCDEAARRRRCSVFEKFPEAGNSPSPFLGSGTTLAASEATQRVCYGIVAMRVCGRFPNSPARARQLYWGWSTFAPRPDGGVLALSFVTALIARPWKVGACQDHLRECSRRASL